MKKLLGIVVLGLLLSGNAYAVKLNKCYWADHKEKELIETKFNDKKFEDNYYEIDFASKKVRKTFILTDWGVNDVLEQKKKLYKALNIPEDTATAMEKITSSTYNIIFVSKRYVKAEKILR